MPDLLEGLPVELIAQIFFIVSQESHASKGYRGLMQSNLWLSSVCSRWRRIALATPSLWSYIHLSATRLLAWGLPDPYGKIDANAISHVRAYLERSGSLSIDIRDDCWDSREMQEAIWTTLLPHLHRARSIEMSGLTQDTASLMFPLSGSGPLERLRDLSLHRVDSSLGDPFTIPCVFRDYHTAPNLNSIALYGITLQNMPVAPVTRLSLYDYTTERSWSNVLLLLAPYPHLQRVTLDFDLVNDSRPLQPLNLPYVTSLFLRESSFDQYLLTPILEHLQYSGNESRIDPKKLPPLKRLTLDRSSERILNDWGSSPFLISLRTLDLVRCHHIPTMLACLSRSEVDSTPSIFPHLHMLRLNGCLVKVEANNLTSVFDVLDARPDLSVESDEGSLSFSPFKWSELQSRSGGRLSKLADDTFTDSYEVASLEFGFR